MATITDYTAVVLLALGAAKMIIGIVSPKTLLNYKKNPFSKLYLENKAWRIGIIGVLALFMIYVSFLSNLTLAQWFVAGYTMLVIFTSFLFFSDKVLKFMMDYFAKVNRDRFRVFCAAMLVLELVALYIILK